MSRSDVSEVSEMPETMSGATTQMQVGISPVRKFANIGMSIIILLATILVVTPLIAIFGYLFAEGIGAIKLIELPANNIRHTLTAGSLLLALTIMVSILSGIALGQTLNAKSLPKFKLISNIIGGAPAIVLGISLFAFLGLTNNFNGFGTLFGIAALVTPVLFNVSERIASNPEVLDNMSASLKIPKWATGLLVALPLLLAAGFLIRQGLALDYLNLDFFVKSPAPEGEAGGGLANAITGSFIMLTLASIIGVVVGISGGIFLAEYPRHPLMPIVRFLSDVLAGIPAIVMGLVAYGILVSSRGFSGYAGALALGFLMIPIVVRTTEEVLKLVPVTVREAGLGLGLPQWIVTLRIVLPAAASGIVTGIMLALARVAGEAAPLIFTAFGSNIVNLNPSQPMSALPLEIYRGATSAYDENQRMAKAGALLLISMIFVASLLARKFSNRK